MKMDAALALARGAATHIPFAYRAFGQRRMCSDGVSPEYPYHVWLKHLCMLNTAIGVGVPEIVAELGPGDTLGVGAAALLCGARRHVAVDALAFARRDETRALTLSLAQRFKNRAPVTDQGWPHVHGSLDANGFPSSILPNSLLRASLEDRRLDRIIDDLCSAIDGTEPKGKLGDYHAPMMPDSIKPEQIDFFLSHSVLEHVNDLSLTIGLLHRWLKPGAVMSHQFDLTSHNLTRAWDGHRAFGKRSWPIVVGCRPFLINRIPFSSVVRIIEQSGFRMLLALRQFAEPTLPREMLCSEWRLATEEDWRTMGGFIVAQKL